MEILSWLINIGHRILDGLRQDLEANHFEERNDSAGRDSAQLCLTAVRSDSVAWPIVEKARSLESNVEAEDEKTVIVRYVRK